MKQYTATELEAIRKLSTLEEDEEEIEITQDDPEGEEGLMDLSALFGQEEEPIEKRVEASYLSRLQTGRGLYKLHGQSEPTRIYW
jgi:hypothetical protein